MRNILLVLSFVTAYTSFVSSINVSVRCWCYFQLETTIKQAEEEKNKAVENIRHLVSDCTPLQAEINLLRSSLGLELQPDATLGEQQLFIEWASMF